MLTFQTRYKLHTLTKPGYLSTYLSIYPSVYLSINRSIHIHPSIHPLVQLCIRLSNALLPISLPVFLPIYIGIYKHIDTRFRFRTAGLMLQGSRTNGRIAGASSTYQQLIAYLRSRVGLQTFPKTLKPKL